MVEQDKVLRVNDLHTYFYTQSGTVRAVDGATFAVKRGQVLGIVGESGCGKSITALSILRIVPRPGKIVSGQILYHRRLESDPSGSLTEMLDLIDLPPRGPQMRSIRGGEISMVFQEPMTSLDPVYTVGDQIMEAIALHQKVNRREARKRAIEMLEQVGMPRPDQIVDRYPHQLSGGMQQRVMIAIALSCRPSLLIADEPTTALDVTTEAQILDLMRVLQKQTGCSIMYITHNLGVIAEMAEDVLVMYLGKVVEKADVHTLFSSPKHPYTCALLGSIPKIGRKSRTRLEAIAGVVPDPLNLPTGCRFHNRCTSFMAGICNVEEPPVLDIGDGHLVRCFLYQDTGKQLFE